MGNFFSSKPKRDLSSRRRGLYRPDVLNLVMLGAGGVGKSSLTIQFVTNQFLDEYDPTIEDSYRKQITFHDDGQPLMLDILDLQGEEEFSALLDQYMRSGDGYVITYAVNSRDSFEEVNRLYERVLRQKDLEDIPAVLVGNKIDLEEERAVSRIEGQDLADSWRVPFLEASALTRENVDEIFQSVASKVILDEGYLHPHVNVKAAK